ncbi:MAG TPA: FecR domain-containing protein, partial [Chitinophaga sp.]
VRVRKGPQQAILHPGQQARVGTTFNVISNVNINQVVAWKNGFFNFENMRLREVMQQLERWYNITVVYEGTVPDVRFFGELRRDMNLSGIIAALRDSGVQFRLEGNRLIVLPS